MIQEYTLINSEKTQQSALKVIKEYDISNILGNNIMPSSIVSFFIEQLHLNEEMEEHLYMLMIRGRTIKGVSELGHGGWNCCPVDIKSVITRLLLSGADSFVLVHNHPGGSIDPSKEDYALTKSIKESVKMIDCTLLDHIIISFDKCYLSMYENTNIFS